MSKKISLLLTFSILASLLLSFPANASVSLFSKDAENQELTDGIYNIKNKETGLYLDVFDFSFDGAGKAYLAEKSGKDGQDFLIRRQDNGEYLLYPQSENGLYALTYSSDILEGEYITKTAYVSGQCIFGIIPNEDAEGEFVIRPSGMSDSKLAVGVSSEMTKAKDRYACISLGLLNDKTVWSFEKVSSEYISISGGYIDVKVGETKQLHAKLYPEYLVGNLKWSSSNEGVAMVDDNGLVRGISNGCVIISVECGGASASCTVNVTDLPAYTWYSQHNIYSGGWYAEPVANLTLKTRGGERKKFFVSGFNHNIDWMDEACKICSVAMVLNNMGAKLSTGYDMRFDALNNLDADPYTVILANTNSSGYSFGDEALINQPNTVNNHLINPRFTVGGKNIVSTTKYTNSISYIKEQLDKHPEGVIVEMNNYAKDICHYIVFTECVNPDDPNGKYKFTVCDSAATNSLDGDNILFEDSISYKQIGYRYSCITSVTTYSVVK